MALVRADLAQIWFLPLVALMFLGSQVAVLDTAQVRHLWMVSAGLGFAYGSLFNALPMLVLEWFGMSKSPQACSVHRAAPCSRAACSSAHRRYAMREAQ